MAHESTYEPKGRFSKWMDDRLPIMRLTSDFLAMPTPRNLNYLWTFGGILFFFLVVQLITGIILVMHYIPHEKMAFDSVEHIVRDVNWGDMIQNMHANGASFFFIAVYIHILRGMYYGSYKAPREIMWILGVIIYLLMMASAFLGYVLPWGQMSLWGATVITNLFSAIPFVGEAITQWLWGGYAVGQPTLNRFLSFHYLVPFILTVFVVLHIWALHVVGSNNPDGVEPRPDHLKEDTLPFHTYFSMKDAFALSAFAMLFVYFVFYMPDFMGHPDNYKQADPLVTPPHIVPEWYFLPFYAILRAVPDKFLGVVLMFASILIVALLPWFDTSKVRSMKYRPTARIFFWLFVISAFILGYLGGKPAEGGYVIVSQILTFYWFAYFFILFFLGLMEKTEDVPGSISEAVLKKNQKN